MSVRGRVSLSAALPKAPPSEGCFLASTSTSKILLQIFTFGCFAVGNIGLNVFNQWALNRYQGPHFVFPVFYTMWHMVVSALVAYILLCCVVKPELGMPSFRQFWEYKFALIPISYCTTISTWLNNASFTLVTLFLNQAIRAVGPLPTCFFSWLLAGRRYSWPIIACVGLICMGSVLSCFGQLKHRNPTRSDENDPAGIVTCIISLVIASLKPVVAMIVMQGDKDHPKLDPVVVLFYDSGLAFVFMLIYWVCSNERQESIDYLTDPATTDVGIFIIVVGASMAFVYNMSTYYVCYKASNDRGCLDDPSPARPPVSIDGRPPPL